MPVRFGADEPSAFYLGRDAVDKLYLGETEVWGAGGGDQPAVLRVHGVAVCQWRYLGQGLVERHQRNKPGWR